MNRNITLIVIMLVLILSVGCGIQSNDQEDDEGVNQTVEYNFPKESEGRAGLDNFTTLDVYGEEVNQSIFNDYDLTMINIWGTFCSPCLKEMPDLGEINSEYEDQGFSIIGIVVDVQNEDGSVDYSQIEKAQDIIANTEADYPHLLQSNNLISGLLSEVQYIPHTVFVDSDGNIIGEEYVGSRSKGEWIEIIESML